VLLLPAGLLRHGSLNPEGYTALSLFPHPLVVPQRLTRETLEEARRVNPFALPEEAQLWASVSNRKVRRLDTRRTTLRSSVRKTPNVY
jgi:hypothetical protein